MERVRVGDLDMCYRLHGEGPPLVMIMGLTANLDWWSPELVDNLSRHYRLLLFDNRCAGRTPPGDGPFTIRQFARDTAGLMEAVGIERAHVLGVSMGGMIAQELALNYPDRVNRLVLGCTFCGGVHSARPGLGVLARAAVRSPDPEVQARRSLSILFSEKWLSEHAEVFDDFVKRVSIAFITPDNARRQMRAVLRFNTYRRLPGLENPTLVMCGSDDILVPAVNSRILTLRIPDSRLLEFSDAGHGFIHQCRVEAEEAVVEFLGT